MSLNDEYILKNAKKLEYGRIDTFVASYYHAMYELKEMGMDSKVGVAGCTSFEKFYLAFSPQVKLSDSTNMVMKYFDGKMSELIKTRKIAKIMKRYGLEDWSKIE